MIEAIEEFVGLFFCQSDAGVHYLDDGILIVLAHHEGDVSAIEGILHGIGEQVGDDLVKVDAVYPNLQGVAFFQTAVFFQLQGNATLLSVKLVERQNAAQEFLEVGLLAVQVHLVLIYLTLVQNLVYQ